MRNERVPVVERGAQRATDIVVEVAAALDGRTQEIGRDISESLTANIPEIRGDDRLHDALIASVQANVLTFLHVLQQAASMQEAEAPPAAVGYARRLAQRGISQVALIRTYRLGHACFLRWCFRALDSYHRDNDLAVATQSIVDLSFQYIDLVAEQVATAYETERDRWSRNRAATQRAQVRAVVNGEPFDLNATERLLDYRFAQHHIGAVVWCPRSGDVQSLLHLEHAIERIGTRLSSHAPAPLFIPLDDATAWAWLALPAVAEHRALSDAIDDLTEPIRLALGDDGVGVEGFRQTHREALRAQSVALNAGDGAPRITRFSDIAPIATLSTDIEFTRSWVHATLGELASADPAQERLRETALAFLRSGASFTATAEALDIHKNTVHYRIQKLVGDAGPAASRVADRRAAGAACVPLVAGSCSVAAGTGSPRLPSPLIRAQDRLASHLEVR